MIARGFSPRAVPAAQASALRRPAVLVIGGGLAGLAAATRLAAAGCAVTLAEGRGTLGGRTQSFVDEATGDEVDTGQHALLGCYVDMLAFLERIGTRSAVRLQPALAVSLAHAGGARSTLACPELPAPMHLALGLLGHASLSWPEKARCLRVLGDARARWDDPALDTITVAEWLAGLGQSANACRHLWTPLTLATLNASPEGAAASMLAVVVVRGLLAGGLASSLGLADVSLSRLIGEPAGRFLASRGAAVLLNEPARALVVERGRCVGALLRGDDPVEADVVIAAVPAPALLKLLPPEVARQAPFAGLAAFHPSPIVSLHAWLDRPVLDVPFLGLTDGDAHWIFDRDRLWGRPASGGHLVTVVSSGADDLAACDREEAGRRLWRDVVAAVPAAAAARIVRSLVVRERSATFRATPGLGLLRFGPETPLPGLLVAGDWTATGLPATMEGACVSGHAAAERVVA